MRAEQPVDHAGTPRRIGLIGAESSGKTTLAQALAARLPACVVPEVLREFTARHGRPPRIHEQRSVLEGQWQREDDVAAACRMPWLVGDPAPLMTAVYSLEYFGDDSLLADAVAQARGYELLVWCAPDIPWEADALQRDGLERRTSTESTISRVLDQLGTGALTGGGNAPVLRVMGSVDSRVGAVLERLAWQPGGSTALT